MIICGIASIPSRESSLRLIIDAIAPQVNHVFVVLNGYMSVPVWFAEYPNVLPPVIDDNSKGDAMKFWWVENVDGYYLAIDDDLIPPRNYVDNILEGVDKYNGLVSYHGRKYLAPVHSFKQWAGNYRCLGDVSEDVHVNFIGSGCCAFHTDRLKLSLSDFKTKNKADVYISKVATEQGVPMVVLKHDRDLFQYTNPSTTIWKQTSDYSEHLKLIQSFIK